MALQGINNMPILHFYTLFEYGFVVSVLSYWQSSLKMRRIMIASILPFVIIFLVIKLLIEDPTGFDSVTSSLSCAILTVASANTLIGLLRDDKNLFNQTSIFWITSGFLLYFTGNLVLFALSTTIMFSTWMIHNALVIISNACYLGGFLTLQRS